MERSIKKGVAFGVGSGALIWQILFFYVPLALLLFTSVISLTFDGYFAGLTTQHFRSLCQATYLHIIFNSLILALGTGLITLLIAYPLAYFMAFNAGRFKMILLFMLIVPFWTNFLLHIYAWFFVLEKGGFLNNLLLTLGLIKEPVHFLNSMFSITLMMVYYFLPFMVLPIYSSLDRFDHRLLEASRDLGASWKQTFRTILLPLSLPSVRAGFFLVFIPAFGEFAIPELMGGDRHYFVGNVVSQFILGHGTGNLGAAFTVFSCAFLLAAACLLFILFGRLEKWLVRRSS